jgi:hypothetical protein
MGWVGMRHAVVFAKGEPICWHPGLTRACIELGVKAAAGGVPREVGGFPGRAITDYCAKSCYRSLSRSYQTWRFRRAARTTPKSTASSAMGTHTSLLIADLRRATANCDHPASGKESRPLISRWCGYHGGDARMRDKGRTDAPAHRLERGGSASQRQVGEGFAVRAIAAWYELTDD